VLSVDEETSGSGSTTGTTAAYRTTPLPVLAQAE
jgi:hypothetical protein